MSYGELIQLYFERSNALQGYWTLYVVVIGGLLAFSSLRKEPDTRTTFIISILFCFFAYKNLDAIHDVTVQRLAAAQAIGQGLANDNPVASGVGVAQLRPILEPTLLPPAYDGVRNFHVASDLITLAAFWAMEHRRRKWAKGK